MNKKWDINFLRLAATIASFSKDKTKIGAVIARDKILLSNGYNGFPSCVEDDERLLNRETKLKYTIHAEMNAILHAGKHSINIKDSTIYIYGLFPCQECAKHIVVAGIKKVVFVKRIECNQSWVEQFEFVKNLFEEAKIEMLEYSGEELEQVLGLASNQHQIDKISIRYYLFDINN